MLKLKVGKGMTFNCSGVSITCNYCVVEISNVKIQISHSYSQDECIYLDVEVTEDVPVLVVDGFRFPLYGVIKYKNLEFYHLKDKS